MGPILFPVRRAAAAVLFLKAIKNQAGYALYGDPPRWHSVSADKPAPAGAHHVALSHYHVAAVKKLQGDVGFHALAPHEQVHKVKGLAAEMQSSASQSAAVSMWKKAALAGQNPTPAQWKAFYSLPKDKRDEMFAQVISVDGSTEHLLPPPDLVPPPAEPEKPASPNPWTDEQWSQLYLPPTNSNAPSHNKKIDALKNAADAGDVAAISAMKFGSNTYGKKQAKVAEHLLADMGGGAAVLEPGSAPTPAAPKVVSVSANPTTSAEISPEQEAGLIGWINAGKPTSKHPKSWSNLWKTLTKDQKEHLAEKAAGAKSRTPKVLSASATMSGVKDKLAQASEPPNVASVSVKKPAAPELAHSFFNQDDGVAAIVHKHADGKWSVQLKDTDADAVLPQIHFYPTEEQAVASAKAAAGLTSRAPKAEPPKVASVSVKKPAESVTVTAQEFQNTQPGHNKFWAVSTSGNVMKTTYGKIGSKGQTTEKEFSSPKAAYDAAFALIMEKKAKGYESVGSVQHTYSKMPGAPDTGPKEGDTKQGADGLLVLKNGRWVKVDDAPKLAEAAKNAIDSMSLDELLAIEDSPGLPPASAAYIKQKIAASAGAAPLQDVAAAAPQPSPGPANIDGWKQVGGQMGSNTGGLYEAPDGTKWYCKFPADPDHAKSELLAAALYEAAGVSVPHTRPIMRDGKFGIASKWQDGLQTVTAAKLTKAKGAHAGFAVDAWLANYDAVGLANDNMQLSKDGSAVRVDVGGSLEYRAQGKKKAFGQEVDELATMRDPSVNPKAAAVFGKMTDADIAASVAKVLSVPEIQIHDLVMKYGPGSTAERKKLANTLIARQVDLAHKFPQAAKPKKQRQDPTKLKVDAAKLPKPHDFANWNGAGKGLSSKAHVNAANQQVEQEMLGVAKKGNLPDLKDFKFHALDKETGKPTGQAHPISEHPSKHVVQYHSDLVQVLDEIANPPRPLKLFQSTDATSVEAIDSAFQPKPFGTTVGKVKSNEKLGFWVVLGGVTSPEKLKPKKTSHLTAAAVAAAHEKFKEAPKLAKHFISSVQASGSYNDLFRDGKTHDHSGNSLADVAKAALEYATSQPEGTTVYRWQNMSDSMVQKMLSAPDGTVIQATGPMCTSYSPSATKGFGKHRVMIHYAKGAKAVESFGSGKYASEKEITTLPNARFVVLSKSMVSDKEHGGGQRLDLQLLMLPPDIGISGESK